MSTITRTLSEMLDPQAWADWLASLDRGFVFLLLLPFVVALVGLWSSGRDRDGEED